MILEDIAQGALTGEQARLRTQLQAAQAELKTAKQQHSAVYHQGKNVVVSPHVARLENLVAALKTKLAAAHHREETAQEIRAAHARLATVDVDKDKREFARSNGARISDGHHRWNELYANYGGERGLVADMYQAAMQLTHDGVDDLDVKELASRYGVGWRQLYNKLANNPHYNRIALLMPKNH